MRLLVSAAAVSWLIACQSPSAPPEQASAPAAALPIPAVPAGPRLLHEAAARRPFSSRTAPDQFRLQLRGDSVLTGTLHLSIVSVAGDTLLSERFPAQALLDYGLLQYGEHPTRAQREAYVRERMDQFFGPGQFRSPAIKPTEQYVARQSERGVWEEVRQTGLPGFFYHLYEEDGRSLAYLPRRRKAVVFRTCC